MDTVGESMDAMGAVKNGNVNQEKKKISLGCGQAQRFGGVRPVSKGTRFKPREGKEDVYLLFSFISVLCIYCVIVGSSG